MRLQSYANTWFIKIKEKFVYYIFLNFNKFSLMLETMYFILQTMYSHTIKTAFFKF